MTNFKALATLLLTVTFVLSPLVSTTFAGFDPGDFPVPQIDPPVQPAGWAFSIWGLIYAWLTVSAVYGLWRRATDVDWDRVRTPLIGALAIGTPWLAVAAASPPAATVMILAMAALAALALMRAPARDRWLLRAPVSLFAGWLTAASAASTGISLAGFDILMGGTGWALVCILAALGAAVAVQRAAPRAPGYALAVAWALAGIVAANLAGPVAVLALALAGLATMLVLAVQALRRA